MSQINGPLIERCQQAILHAFSHDELRQLVHVRLEENFEAITLGANLQVRAFELLLWAGRHDREGELLDVLAAERPRNEELAALAACLRAGQPLPGPAAPSPSAPGPSVIGGPIPLQKPLRNQHFTGRDLVLALLLADLQSDEQLTLCGPGGMGKTALAVEVKDAPLPADLSANWRINWSCNSDRCEVKECSADVSAAVTRAVANGYLPVEHKVTWADECFNTDAWTFEVNQITGQERSGKANDNFLYGYWLGAEPGVANGVFSFDDERSVLIYCSDEQQVEIEEGSGWTTVYIGHTCHDVKTGMLVYMNYAKRWLFTGNFEGKTYSRSYFGDSEKLEQRLVDTNAKLAFIEKR